MSSTAPPASQPLPPRAQPPSLLSAIPSRVWVALNCIAIVTFAYSAAQTARLWSASAPPAALLTHALTACASLAYMFGFFAVCFVATELLSPHAKSADATIKSASSSSSSSASSSTAVSTPVAFNLPAAIASLPAEAQRAHTAAGAASVDVIVIGCGVAGACMAVRQARAGRRVLVVERDMSEQDRIVGELLQPGGIEALRELGLHTCAADPRLDCVDVHGYALITPIIPPSRAGAAQPFSAEAPCERHEYVLLRYPQAAPSTMKEALGFGSVPKNVDTNDEAHRALSALGYREGEQPTGRSFHHGRFVQRLREAVRAEPNVTVIEGSVTRILSEGGVAYGVAYRPRLVPSTGGSCADQPTEDAVSASTFGEEVQTHSKMVAVCDGLWSSLRKSVSSPNVVVRSFSVGVIMRHPAHRPPLPHRNHGHVMLAYPTPVLLYQISSTETRVLVDVPKPMPSSANGDLVRYLRDVVASQLPADFGLRALFLESLDVPNNIKSMPNRTLAVTAPTTDRVVLVGDAQNMRHPLTGGGMTVAIKDVCAISRALDSVPDLRDWRGITSAVRRFHDARRGHAATINVLSVALYSVFSAPPGMPERQSLRDACYRYLSLGGAYTAGPIGLLAGLTPVPGVLTTHFFLVALYSMRNALSPFPSPRKLRESYRLLQIATNIIMPLLKDERATFLSWKPVQSLARLVFPAPPARALQ